jgi:hypothetical protein
MAPTIKTGPAILQVKVLSAENKKPVEGIPVSCNQPNTKWQDQARITDENGIVEFDGLLEGEFARTSTNYGGYFGFLQGEQSSVPIFPQASGLNKRTVYLVKGTSEHKTGTAPNNLCEQE